MSKSLLRRRRLPEVLVIAAVFIAAGGWLWPAEFVGLVGMVLAARS